MIKKVKYTCSKCGWNTSIRSEWSDLRPKRCLGKRCGTSFLKEPSALLVEQPKVNDQAKITKPAKEQVKE